MRTILNKFNKEDLQNLPKVVFPGKIYVVDRPEQVDQVCRFLSGFQVLGIDSETKPNFKKGRTNKVSLLQICPSDEVCYLFRLNKVGITLPLVNLLENRSIEKVGLSLKDDTRALHARAPFIPGGFTDLQNVVKTIGIEDMSLQKIYANLFHGKISKSQQLSDWEAPELSEAQRQYGAIDAWACLRIYHVLGECIRNGDYRLEIITPPESATKEDAVL